MWLLYTRLRHVHVHAAAELTHTFSPSAAHGLRWYDGVMDGITGGTKDGMRDDGGRGTRLACYVA